MEIKNQLLTILFFCMLAGACSPAKKTEAPLADIAQMKAAPYPLTDTLLRGIISRQHLFDSILSGANGNEVQVIYTQIDRDARNEPSFRHYYYGYNPGQYFYPASTVKLPAAVLSLQKLRTLNIPGLLPSSTMITEAAFGGQSAVYNDPSTPDGRPNIAHYIKKILLVSDNDAFNRLYEFLGQEYLNTTLHSMGMDSAQIVHRLEIALSEEENRHTNPITFLDDRGKELYKQPLVRSNLPYQQRHTFRGKGFMRKGVLINEPFDFSAKNRLNLFDLHKIVQAVMFPSVVPARQRFQLHDSDYVFIRKYMSMYPSESKFPAYDSSYNDSYVKFLYYGSTDPAEPHIRIFNKVGDAYGFLTDAAYIVDFANGVEFMLSAVVHCNSDGIYNDSKYDYEKIGFPFLRLLGREIYQYELQRKKDRLPDLSAFRFNYRE